MFFLTEAVSIPYSYMFTILTWIFFSVLMAIDRLET